MTDAVKTSKGPASKAFTIDNLPNSVHENYGKTAHDDALLIHDTLSLGPSLSTDVTRKILTALEELFGTHITGHLHFTPPPVRVIKPSMFNHSLVAWLSLIDDFENRIDEVDFDTSSSHLIAEERSKLKSFFELAGHLNKLCHECHYRRISTTAG